MFFMWLSVIINPRCWHVCEVLNLEGPAPWALRAALTWPGVTTPGAPSHCHTGSHATPFLLHGDQSLMQISSVKRWSLRFRFNEVVGKVCLSGLFVPGTPNSQFCLILWHTWANSKHSIQGWVTVCVCVWGCHEVVTLGLIQPYSTPSGVHWNGVIKNLPLCNKFFTDKKLAMFQLVRSSKG